MPLTRLLISTILDHVKQYSAICFEIVVHATADDHDRFLQFAQTRFMCRFEVGERGGGSFS